MKVVIFAGGLGTRISEETHLRPKSMSQSLPSEINSSVSNCLKTDKTIALSNA